MVDFQIHAHLQPPKCRKNLSNFQLIVIYLNTKLSGCNSAGVGHSARIGHNARVRHSARVGRSVCVGRSVRVLRSMREGHSGLGISARLGLNRNLALVSRKKNTQITKTIKIKAAILLTAKISIVGG